MRPLVVVSVVVVVFFAAACFDLSRSRGLGEAKIRLRVVDVDGVPVAGALLSVDGSARVATSAADGRAELPRLLAGDRVLRVFVDDDADGAFDRGAIVDHAGVALAGVQRGAFTSPVEEITAQDLGDVVVRNTVRLGGSVSGCDGEACRVVVYRELEIGTVARRTVAGSAEATAVVAADGAWTVDGIVPGPVKVVALRWAATATTPVQQMIEASRPDRFGIVDVDGSTDVDGIEITLAAAPASIAADLELAGALGDVTRLSGQIFWFAPETSVDVDIALTASVPPLDEDAQPRVGVDAPPGVVDVQVQIDDGSAGVLRRAVVVPGVATLHPVEIGPVLVCSTIDDVEDCDGDGLTVDEDDDDDADGQPDADETAPCRGPGRGTDYDGDCLCEPADPVPGCASNDLADCVPAAPIVCD